jgi:hypothetical protein
VEFMHDSPAQFLEQLNAPGRSRVRVSSAPFKNSRLARE